MKTKNIPELVNKRYLYKQKLCWIPFHPQLHDVINNKCHILYYTNANIIPTVYKLGPILRRPTYTQHFIQQVALYKAGSPQIRYLANIKQ